MSRAESGPRCRSRPSRCQSAKCVRDDSGRVVLGDFGAGREVDAANGELAGTPVYVAPEIFNGERRHRDRTSIVSAYCSITSLPHRSRFGHPQSLIYVMLTVAASVHLSRRHVRIFRLMSLPRSTAPRHRIPSCVSTALTPCIQRCLEAWRAAESSLVFAPASSPLVS